MKNKLTNLRAIIVSILLGIVLSACSGTDMDAFEADLLGTWKTSCLYSSSRDTYALLQKSYDNNELSGDIKVFADADCSQPLYTITYAGTYNVGQEIILTSGKRVRAIDFVFSQWMESPDNVEMRDDFNNSNYCGKTDWVAGELVDVTNCSDFLGSDKQFDIVSIESDRLFLGDFSTGDGTSADNRPTQLESVHYLKQ